MEGAPPWWRTHSCVPRSHSCERHSTPPKTCSHECEHGTHECVRHTEQAQPDLLHLEFLPPFSGLLRFPPALVELHDPLPSLRHQGPAVGGHGSFPLNHPFTARNQERLRLSEPLLARQARTQKTLEVITAPGVGPALLSCAGGFA